MGIWPVSDKNDTTHRTVKDQLLAFCSTVGELPYFFQRDNAQSRTYDYANIPRNQQLYSYLQNLTSSPIPGFGGPSLGFLSKYSATDPLGLTPAVERDQILTEIFDYIRCANTSDPILTSNGGIPYSTPWGNNVQGQSGAGMVAPIQIGTNGTKGFGRIDTFDLTP